MIRNRRLSTAQNINTAQIRPWAQIRGFAAIERNFGYDLTWVSRVLAPARRRCHAWNIHSLLV